MIVRSRILRYLEPRNRFCIRPNAVGQVVSQLHLGGGTPTVLSMPGCELMTMLKRSFTLLPVGEYSIEGGSARST